MQTSGNFIVGIIDVNTDPSAFLLFSAGVCDESSKAAYSQIALSRQLKTDWNHCLTPGSTQTSVTPDTR